MKPGLVAFLSVLALWTAGCIQARPQDDASATSGTTTAEADLTTGTPDFKTVEKGDQSRHPAIDKPGLVIADNETWVAFWRKHATVEGSSPPTVNFSNHFVLAMLLGEQPSAGYAIDVEQVSWEEARYTIAYSKTRPGPGCPVASVITNPFHIVKVDRVRPDVPSPEFDDRGWTEHACG